MAERERAAADEAREMRESVGSLNQRLSALERRVSERGGESPATEPAPVAQAGEEPVGEPQAASVSGPGSDGEDELLSWLSGS